MGKRHWLSPLCAVSVAAAPFPGCVLDVRPGRREGIEECWLPESGVADYPHHVGDFRLALPGPHDHGGGRAGVGGHSGHEQQVGRDDPFRRDSVRSSPPSSSDGSGATKITAPTPVNSHAAAHIAHGRCDDHNVIPPRSVPVSMPTSAFISACAMGVRCSRSAPARRIIGPVSALTGPCTAACHDHGADGQAAREKRLMREFQAPQQRRVGLTPHRIQVRHSRSIPDRPSSPTRD